MQELEHLVHTGCHLAAARRFEHLLRQGALHGRELAVAYHLGGVAYYHLGNLLVARRCAERASTLACESHDDALLLQVEMHLPTYYRGLGELGLAIQCGRDWLATARGLPVPPLDLAAVHYNLAMAYRASLLPEKALEHAQQACALFREVEHLPGLPGALQLAAWSAYDLGQVARGDAFAAEAATFPAFSPETRSEQALLQAYRLLRVEEYAQAAAVCESLLLSPDLTDLQRFWAAWVLCKASVGEAELAPQESRQEAALHLSALTMDIATRLRREDLINQAQRLRQEALAG